MNPTDAAHRREALRQQLLLRVLWRDADSGVLQGHARPVGAHALRTGVTAYRGNAGAVAARALAGTFPTLAELVGDDTADALARDFWRHQPPARGDLAQWGDALPGFIAASAQLADEPFLADVARLEWQVHRASRAADAPDAVPDLQALADADPSKLMLTLAPGTALVSSPWPVAAIWLAHRRPAHDEARFADVRDAFAGDRAETALVWRDGPRVRVAAVAAPDAAFVRALLDPLPLSDALDAAGSGFAFDRWLADAFASRLLTGMNLQE